MATNQGRHGDNWTAVTTLELLVLLMLRILPPLTLPLLLPLLLLLLLLLLLHIVTLLPRFVAANMDGQRHAESSGNTINTPTRTIEWDRRLF
jgi:hypothetical protein